MSGVLLKDIVWQEFIIMILTWQCITVCYLLFLMFFVKKLKYVITLIRGIEWTGLRSVITFGYGEGSKVKNEVFITDIRTGQTMSIRTDKSNENPISILRVSPLRYILKTKTIRYKLLLKKLKLNIFYRQYFVIYLKEGPFELWDLATLTLLRAITKKFPSLTAIV